MTTLNRAPTDKPPKKLSKRKRFKIYDMRNLYSVKLMKKRGFDYYSIGR